MAQVKAYVLVQTTTNAAHVAREIRAIEGVEVADDISGPYDVIAVVRADSMDALGQLVVSKIQAIEGITRTLTCPVPEISQPAERLDRPRTSEPCCAGGPMARFRCVAARGPR